MNWHPLCSRETHEPHEPHEVDDASGARDEVRVGTSEWEVRERGGEEKRRGGDVERWRLPRGGEWKA